METTTKEAQATRDHTLGCPPEIDRRMAGTTPVAEVPTGVAGQLGSCWAAAADRPDLMPMAGRPAGVPTTPSPRLVAAAAAVRDAAPSGGAAGGVWALPSSAVRAASMLTSPAPAGAAGAKPPMGP